MIYGWILHLKTTIYLQIIFILLRWVLFLVLVLSQSSTAAIKTESIGGCSICISSSSSSSCYPIHIKRNNIAFALFQQKVRRRSKQLYTQQRNNTNIKLQLLVQQDERFLSGCDDEHDEHTVVFKATKTKTREMTRSKIRTAARTTDVTTTEIQGLFPYVEPSIGRLLSLLFPITDESINHWNNDHHNYHDRNITSTGSTSRSPHSRKSKDDVVDRKATFTNRNGNGIVNCFSTGKPGASRTYSSTILANDSRRRRIKIVEGKDDLVEESLIDGTCKYRSVPLSSSYFMKLSYSGDDEYAQLSVQGDKQTQLEKYTTLALTPVTETVIESSATSFYYCTVNDLIILALDCDSILFQNKKEDANYKEAFFLEQNYNHHQDCRTEQKPIVVSSSVLRGLIELATPVITASATIGRTSSIDTSTSASSIVPRSDGGGDVGDGDGKSKITTSRCSLESSIRCCNADGLVQVFDNQSNKTKKKHDSNQRTTPISALTNDDEDEYQSVIIVVAAIIGLNLLESMIRNYVTTNPPPLTTTNDSTTCITIITTDTNVPTTTTKRMNSKNNKTAGVGGGAPLLKDMIDRIGRNLTDKYITFDAAHKNASCTKQTVTSSTTTNNIAESTLCCTDPRLLRSILQCLLLPSNGGLNLRNLLWHGFIGNHLPRPWLALIIILCDQLEQQQKQRQQQQQQQKQHTEGGCATNSSGMPKRIGLVQSSSPHNSNNKNKNTISPLSLRQYAIRLEQVVQRGARIRSQVVATAATTKKNLKMRTTSTKNVVTIDDDIASPSNSSNKETQLCNSTNYQNDTITMPWWIDPTFVPVSYRTLWDYFIKEITRLSLYKEHSGNEGQTAERQRTEKEDAEADTFTRPQPVILSIIMTILLEHILRVLYCEVNPERNAAKDQIAQKGRYYITLDGHGQLNQHDILLHPYQLHYYDADNTAGLDSEIKKGTDFNNNPNVKRKNRLVEVLGGNLFALLMDLFVSGTKNGPNLRSAMAHGKWDIYIQRELVHLTSQARREQCINDEAVEKEPVSRDHDDDMETIEAGVVQFEESNDTHGEYDNASNYILLDTDQEFDVVDIMLVIMEQLSLIMPQNSTVGSNNISSTYNSNLNAATLDGDSIHTPSKFIYRPIYSFTATTVERLHGALTLLEQLQSMIHIENLQWDTAQMLLSLNSNIPETILNRHLCITSASELSGRLSALLISIQGGTINSTPNSSTAAKCESGNHIFSIDHGSTASSWTAEDVYIEYETNKILEPLTATRSLLDDIQSATKAFLEELLLTTSLSSGNNDVLVDNPLYTVESTNDFSRHEQRIRNRNQQPMVNANSLRSRQRNRMKRVRSLSIFVLDVYTFAYHVALLSLENSCYEKITRISLVEEPNDNMQGNSSCTINNTDATQSSILSSKEIIKVVERTRMVVSTVQNFIFTNAERSMKAADQYCKGAFVKKIIHETKAKCN